MKSFLLFLFLLAGAVAESPPSPNATLLVEKLRLREFERMLVTPPNLSPAQAAELNAHYGIEPLLARLATRFDTTYTPAQIQGMLALWDDPHMQLLVGDLFGVKAPINQLLSTWMSERAAYFNKLRAAQPSPPKP